eukprot:TRINITY_DN4138_c0_g2_i3.p1 TRINITY_DN4138_c0_g2~~TRINITY_DN4138_c0_g2_i3.p1  ORF type:complete len:255 (-),score=52.29 TRINITY_DN4138_c0_g2_i3:33-797(-)
MREDTNMMKTLGAEVEICPMVPSTDPNYFQTYAIKRAEELGGFYTNQFDNLSNFESHYTTTAPEIWEQTNQKIDIFASASGTGGTLAGVSQFLKKKSEKIMCYYIDCVGSGVIAEKKNSSDKFMSFRNRTPEEKTPHSTVLEGVGSAKVYGNLSNSIVDGTVTITDEAAIGMSHYLLKKDGLFIGPSGGLNVAGAYLLAKKFGPGLTIVTLLCDSGRGYITKTFDEQFLKDNKIDVGNIDSLKFLENSEKLNGI